jgi:hypothetical protein
VSFECFYVSKFSIPFLFSLIKKNSIFASNFPFLQHIYIDIDEKLDFFLQFYKRQKENQKNSKMPCLIIQKLLQIN